MTISIFGKRGAVHAHPASRGYHIVYRANETNYCPGCGRSQWYKGRLSAECAFCGTALPLEGAGTFGVGLIRHGRPPARDLPEAA